MIEVLAYVVALPTFMFMIAGYIAQRSMKMSEFCYEIVEIDAGCYDLYVSDDDGYTWEYYGMYTSREWAVEDGEAAILYAESC